MLPSAKRKSRRRTPTLKSRFKSAKRRSTGGKWIRAVKMLNKGKGKFCIPRKGSTEYAKAKALMNKL